MIIYTVHDGSLTLDGVLIGRGYSGQPQCKNDPAKCSAKDEGPIPPGSYTIGEPVDTATHGPFVLPLTPHPDNEMYGRSGFLIHGDSIKAPGTASHGCIVVSRTVRELVHECGERTLVVEA